MGQPLRRFLRFCLGISLLAAASMAFAPVAEAQFFNWFNSEPAPRPRPVRPKPPGDDLPPIVPRESTAPPPPDDRPYDGKLMRLAEILGAIHYLRELCGAQEGQLWRDQMKEILKNEGSTAVRRAKLVNSFNDGYRGYRRTYRTCTQSATLATARFSTEGAQIAASLAQGSTFANKNSSDTKPAGAAPDANKQGSPPPEPSKEGTASEANKENAPASAVGNNAAGANSGGTPAANSNAATTTQPAAGTEAQATETNGRHHKHHKAEVAAPQPAEAPQGAPEPADQGF
jgi:uncharacterized protein (TIGR02301 family)